MQFVYLMKHKVLNLYDENNKVESNKKDTIKNIDKKRKKTDKLYNYTIYKKLKSGFSGLVIKGYCKKKRKNIVIKFCSKKPHYLNELNSLRNLNHINIIKLYENIENYSGFVINEYISNSNLIIQEYANKFPNNSNAPRIPPLRRR